MINSKLLLISLVFLFGCIKNKPERNISFDMSQSEYEDLKKECAEISSNGDILVLLNEIKKDTRKIFKLLGVPNPTESKEEITILADGIADKSQKVITLSKHEWTMDRWKHEIKWRIDEGDFKKRSQILDQKVDSIYFMGEQRDDLKDKIFILKNGNNLMISLKKPGSALEICQLQKTLNIIVEVKLKSIKSIKKRYFNLNVQNDFTETL